MSLEFNSSCQITRCNFIFFCLQTHFHVCFSAAPVVNLEIRRLMLYSHLNILLYLEPQTKAWVGSNNQTIHWFNKYYSFSNVIIRTYGKSGQALVINVILNWALGATASHFYWDSLSGQLFFLLTWSGSFLWG